jgi:hypothetical protein
MKIQNGRKSDCQQYSHDAAATDPRNTIQSVIHNNPYPQSKAFVHFPECFGSYRHVNETPNAKTARGSFLQRNLLASTLWNVRLQLRFYCQLKKNWISKRRTELTDDETSFVPAPVASAQSTLHTSP